MVPPGCSTPASSTRPLTPGPPVSPPGPQPVRPRQQLLPEGQKSAFLLPYLALGLSPKHTRRDALLVNVQPTTARVKHFHDRLLAGRRRTRARSRISFACSPLARRQPFLVPLGVRVILLPGLPSAPE